MFIPDVINTLLMGLIFMVVIVTIVRPFVLNTVGEALSNSDMQKAAMAEIEQEMMRKAELLEAKRADKIKYQLMLLEMPSKPTPKPVIVALPEPELVPEPVVQATAEVIEASSEDVMAEAAREEALDGAAADTDTPQEAMGDVEIEIHEGESLAEIKDRMRKEQQKIKKPAIPPELLSGAKSYEDKVGVVRMVVQADQSRVASVIRGMIQVGK
jgi:hypothetical protein